MKLLRDEDKRAIEEAIRKAEGQTSGEIVFALTDASSHYQHATLQGALAGMALVTAAYLLLPIPPTIPAVLWVEVLSFGLLLGVRPRLPWRRWFIPSREMDMRVHQAALAEFYASDLHRTRESNGVLIYLSILERRVIILGDKAIDEKIGNQWDALRDMIIQSIHEGKAPEGICRAVERCGEVLKQHFPHRADDINELPDSVIERSLRPDAS